MSANVTFQPYAQTGGNNGLFNAQSTGVRQGTAYADPSTRYRLRAGILNSTETLPMWGGVGIYAFVPGGSAGTVGSPGVPKYALGALVGRATALTGTYKLAGFSVFDEAYGMITSPQSPVPLAGEYNQVNYYPLGSLARIAVECDPALVDLRGTNTLAQVSWDFTNQLLVPYLGTLTISSATYNSTTGLVTLTMASAVTFDAGDSITTSGLVGSGSVAQLNGTFTALSASGTTVTYEAPTGLTLTISGGSPTLTVGGSADAELPVEVLDVQSTNCETVVYNTITGFATWNYNGACAVIKI